MDSVWLKRGLLIVVILMAVGCLATLLLPAPQTEPQMQSESQQPPTQQEAQTPQVQTEPQQEAEPEQPEHLYEMGIWEGKVAVFVPGTNVPMRITEMPVASLPEADQKALEERIPVFDGEALASYLEDYGS